MAIVKLEMEGGRGFALVDSDKFWSDQIPSDCIVGYQDLPSKIETHPKGFQTMEQSAQHGAEMFKVYCVGNDKMTDLDEATSRAYARSKIQRKPITIEVIEVPANLNREVLTVVQPTDRHRFDTVNDDEDDELELILH